MPTNVQSRKANYVVKGVETVVAARDIQARIFTRRLARLSLGIPTARSRTIFSY